MAATVITPQTSLNVPSALDPLVGPATCPSCHTEDRNITKLAVSTGADWRCTQCGSYWTARRLATVAAYAIWRSEHTASVTHAPTSP
jgi:transposase-like protein